MNTREIISSHAYPLMAAIGTLSLVLIAVSLLPISKWTRLQNECIEKTFRLDGKNNAGIPAKVWSCNGGGNQIDSLTLSNRLGSLYKELNHFVHICLNIFHFSTDYCYYDKPFITWHASTSQSLFKCLYWDYSYIYRSIKSNEKFT